MTIPSLPQSPETDPYQRRLVAAENRVRRYCGWHIAPVVEQTIVLDGSGSVALFVPTLKLRSVTACKVNGVDIDPTTLEWSEDGFLRRACGWPDRLRSVELTIEHGFEEAPEVAELIMEIAERAGTAVGGRTREQVGAVSISNALVAPGVSGGIVIMEHEKALLDKYKLPGRL